MTKFPGNLGARLYALQAASFVSSGFYQPFFPLWLESKNLSSAVIGFIVAIPIIVRVVAAAPLLSLADHSARRILLAGHAGQIVCFPLLLLAQDSLTIAVLVAFIAVTQAAIFPVLDVVSTGAVLRHPGLNYGLIRGFGSISFFVAAIVAGYVIGAFGPNAVLASLTLIPLLGITATLMALPYEMPDNAVAREGPKPPVSKKIPHVLWLIIVAAALIQGSHGALNGFASIHWRGLGFSDSTIGYLWAAGVIAEILVFMFLGRAVGRGYGLGLLFVGGAAAVIRFTVFSLNPGLGVTFVLQAMHSLSFGATHLGAMAALTALSPHGARGRAQGVYVSLAASANAIATVASGIIYKEAGAAIFAAMVPLATVGFLLMLLAARRLRVQPQSEG
ncbi:MFS transporter [Microvirga alba]|uniref:MFS transporter n=1 Tax=Microvirga alba TaxID=2791025 RepID=A0A931BRH4_9HYPH|nr:MFS transporter [Microvirga alba]MBF9233474.1 MFS transporter [Microvirga alba]